MSHTFFSMNMQMAAEHGIHWSADHVARTADDRDVAEPQRALQG